MRTNTVPTEGVAQAAGRAVAKVTVGLGSCGIAAGGLAVMERLEELLGGDASATVMQTGCVGMCHSEVLVEVDNGSGVTLYGDVTAERVDRIVEEHVRGGVPITDWIVDTAALLNRQRRIVLRNCGHINPDSLDEYRAVGGYTALQRVVGEMTPDEVIDVITASGLRGRGGAGFSTGTKWRFTRAVEADQRYVICNADEGDPGAFMDRSVLEGDPHSVLEGMAIAGYAMGATKGYIYVRAEYPLAIRRLKKAIAEAAEAGLLGEALFGQGFSFSVRLKEGAGAFVCGEETALIASVEGRRGMPRVRPPFPSQSGLWHKPTSINNVETFANVAWIITNGAEEYASLGTDTSKGTKVFALAGKVNHGGLVEVPMGTTIDTMVYEIGGGTPGGGPYKAVQLGGPSGGCVPARLGDTPIDYERLNATGAIMGSGGLVVMDESTCMVDVARFFLSFTQNESCGKCTFCRVGTKWMLEILERICAGGGLEEDLQVLKQLGEQISTASLCGLGQTAANPVLTTLRYFEEEYLEHIRDRRCRAGVCLSLMEFFIEPELCNGCTLCAKDCPTDAIVGERKQVHVIISEKCIKCGNCLTSCRVEAVQKR